MEHAWSVPGYYRVTLWTSNGRDSSTATLLFLVEASRPAGDCASDADTRCLQDSRYDVSVTWRTADGRRGQGTVVRVGTNDSGMFWFFDPNNYEVLVKILDGCAVNGNTWVFAASTTNLGYEIRVVDTATGTTRTYSNEPGRAAPAITDVAAFPCNRG